jgi:cytochrome c556
MNRPIGLAALAALVLGLSAGRPLLSAGGDKKVPSVKEIMMKAHGEDDAVLKKIRNDVRQDDVDWAEVQKLSRELVKHAVNLEKNKAPMGPQDSWKKLTADYTKNAKAVEAGAKKKEKSAVTTPLGAIGKSCGICHKKHKPPED